MKSIYLDWIIENRNIPIEVTEALQEIADKHKYSAEKMNQQKQEIINELYSKGKGYLVHFLFPNGIEDNERWIHALIRMEIRKAQN